MHPQSAILSMPTGAGKTWNARQVLGYWAGQGFKTVYLAPLKALAQEQLAAMQQEFPALKVGLCTGEQVTIEPQLADIIVATHEKFEIYLKRLKLHLLWLAKVQICTFDEVHILSESGRGARLEGLLVKLHQINPFVQIIGLSATLSNAEEIAGWLGGEVLQHGVRPVPLETHFRKHKKDDQKLILLFDILERGKDEGGQTLIFVASRRRAEILDETLREAGYRSRHHHSGLWPDDRLDAESRFRHGGLDILVATSTLEMGVNLPARRVVVYDSFQFGESGPEPLSVQSFLQMIGRSGRPGLDAKGDAYLFSPKWVDDWEYRRGKPEKVFSRLTRPVSFAQFFWTALILVWLNRNGI